MKNRLAEVAGWYGAVAIILSYFLVSFGVIPSNSFTFQFLNLTGALGLMMVSLRKKVYQTVILNIIWSIIAIIAIIQII